MAKTTKVTVKSDEQCVITDKKDTVMIFRESPSNSQATSVELILPNEEDLEGKEIVNSINLATSIAIKLKVDPHFSQNLLQWLADYIQSQSAVDAAMSN